MSVPAVQTRRGTNWIPATAIGLAFGSLAVLGARADPGGLDTAPLALAIALISLAALVRPFEPAPGEKFSLAAAVAFFGVLVLPGAQAVAAVGLAELVARAIRRTSRVSALVNVTKSVGAVAAASLAGDTIGPQIATAPDVRAVALAGALYLALTLAPIAAMIAWTQGARAVPAFIAREWLPTSTLIAIGALAGAVWLAAPAFIVLLALPLAMVEIAGRAAARVHVAHAAAAKALDAQHAFVSDAAHELRNPLAAIRGNLAYLPSETMSAEERDALADARRDVANLGSLVDRLLVLSKADVARDRASSADLSAIAAAVARAAKRRPEVALDLDLGDNIVVAAPPELVEAVVRDVVTNAAAYTERGFVRITVRARGEAAELEVRDSGVGIPPAELPRVFDRFYRGSTARRLAPGSGLGLAIARRIAEAHGGSILLEPASGGGTIARVFLPLATLPL